MSALALCKEAAISPPHYERHKPEQTLLYRIIERQYPAFKAVMAAQGNGLPLHVQQEIDDFLKSGRLEKGIIRVQRADCKITIGSMVAAIAALPTMQLTSAHYRRSTLISHRSPGLSDSTAESQCRCFRKCVTFASISGEK